VSFWISLAGLGLVGLWIFVWRATKRRELGKLVWASPPPGQRWLAIMWLVLAGVKIAEVAMGSARGHTGLDILSVGCYLFCAVIIGFGPTLVSFHEGGVCIGLICSSWSDVVGWSWRVHPAQEVVVSLGIQGQGPRGLCIWITSRGRFIYEPRPRRPIYTRVPFDADLEALLQIYAPHAER
jgi:hypothetical protein